jgi:putative spermidine/putrescine transport system substrate-binding protein
MKRRVMLFLIVLATVSMVLSAQGAKESSAPSTDASNPYEGQTLNLSWWGYNMDLLDKNVVKPFEDAYGVKIVSETGNNSDRLTKMVARKDNPIIDVAFFAGAWAYKAMQEGVIKPYDPAKLTNLSALMEQARDPLGGNYAIGYTIQHLGLFYRPDKVDKITTWRDLSRDDLMGYLSIPGITTTYGPSIIYMLSKAWGGDYEDTEIGWKKIEELAPNLVTVYNVSSQLNTLIAQEEVYAAPYTSFSWGNIMNSGLEVANVIPEEGLVGSFSVVSVGAGTEKDDLVHLFIDHLLSYDVQMAEAMDMVDSPARTDIVLPPEIGDNLTYGEELISKLHFFSEKEMADNQKEWIERWNAIFSN